MSPQHTDLLRESANAIRALREYIMAIPDSVVAALPAMPGVDSDWLDQVQSSLQIAIAAPSAFTPGHPTDRVEQAWLLMHSDDGAGGDADEVLLAVLERNEWYEAGGWKAESVRDSVHANGCRIVGWMPYAVPRPVLATA